MESRLDPIPYLIRLSRRARNVFLRITPEQGLEIVIPYYRKRMPNIERLLTEKRSWIERTLQNIFTASIDGVLHPSRLEKPTQLECQAISKSWNIIYTSKPNAKNIKLKVISTLTPTLELSGNIDDTKRCCSLLKKWLAKQALLEFSTWLKILSITTNLHYQRLIIRGQTTLWGSCNSRKTISLNYKLLFLPRPLAEHVLLHELCHTQYLNHSNGFWMLLKKWDENYLSHKAMLKKAEAYLPSWLSCA